MYKASDGAKAGIAEASRSRAIDFQTSNNSQLLEQFRSQCCPLAKPIVELSHVRLRMADVEYKLYVGMVTFPARQLQVDLEAPQCRIVNRALTRN